MHYYNPVIRGFYPDPSVCYADGWFYLVCSSFEYFPGIPIFKSNNLIDWELIGHCLTKTSQLDLNQVSSSGGLFAPTIRYHKGRFYMIVTNVSGGGNFFVYTDDINGEWSDPIFVLHQGIDPSLMFDGDKVYFTGTGTDENGKSGICQCEIDIETGKILTPSKCISQGSGGRYVEGPHLYHINDYYYLMMSEGGTEYGHMLTLFRSTDPYGPFEACPFNPILTNRNLGGYKIQGAGHADLTHDEQGNWWLVHLAFRQIDKWKPFHHLGREVFLQPVSWTKDGWIKTGVDGTSRIGYTKLDGKWSILNEDEQKQQIWQPNQKEACFLRRPDYSLYRFENNRFYLKGTIDTLDGIGNPTFLGIRQKEFDCIMSCSINGQTMTIGQEAGLSVYMRENNHYDLLVEKEDNNYYIKLILKIGEHGFIINSINLNHSDIKLKITANAGIYMFYAKGDQDDYTYLGRAETKYLSSEVAEGFTGVILAAYCVADKEGKSGWVEYQLIE